MFLPPGKQQWQQLGQAMVVETEASARTYNIKPIEDILLTALPLVAHICTSLQNQAS